jgi:hypothetical protein
MMIDVSKLSEVELNRAMIWCYGDLHPTIDLSGIEDFGDKILIDMGEGYDYSPDYLTDWNLTMPLAVDNDISIINTKGVIYAGNNLKAQKGFSVTVDNGAQNTNPLRAICEVLVMMALEKKNG